MTLLLVKGLFSYLLGSASGSLLLGQMRGVDIRRQGSGNAGATNALRTQGWRFALPVLLFDVGKGMLAATWIAGFGGPSGTGLTPLGTALFCTLCCALGHCYPVWHGFRGGKGAGTVAGGYLLAVPWLAAMALAVWGLSLVCTGYVGLSTVLAGVALGVGVVCVRPELDAWVLAVLTLLLLVWAHRANLQRLRAGTEHRFDRIRLIRF